MLDGEQSSTREIGAAVVVTPGQQGVMPCAAIHDVVGGVLAQGDEQVVACITPDRVGVGAADEPVVTISACQEIFSILAGKKVFAFAAIEQISASVPPESVSAGIATDAVITAARFQQEAKALARLLLPLGAAAIYPQGVQ